jgi:acetoacetate decarboxylase
MNAREYIGIILAVGIAFACCGCATIMEGDTAQKVLTGGVDEKGNFIADQKIMTLAQPDDLALYRKLLPAQFDIPTHPLVGLVVVDYVEVRPWPLTRYQEGYIVLRASYRGEEGWHCIFMPVTKRVAMWGGRSMGFPKYLADKITLDPNGDGWRGEVIHGGTSRLLLTFTPGEVKEEPVYLREKWDLGGPVFQLRPPAKGPAVQVVRSSELGKPEIKTTYGYVTVTIGAAEPGAGLVKPGTTLPGVFIKKTGGNGSLKLGA